jgi:hypothetical protein
MNWAEAQQLVRSGEADGLLQINISPERLKIYDFSEPLLTSEFSIFTSSERPGVTSFFDLRGLRVGVEHMGLPDLLLRQDTGIIVQTPDFLQGFRMLLAGELDAVVADRRVGSYVLAENRIRGVKVAEEPISLSDSTIAVKKGNSSLLATQAGRSEAAGERGALPGTGHWIGANRLSCCGRWFHAGCAGLGCRDGTTLRGVSRQWLAGGGSSRRPGADDHVLVGLPEER